MGMDGIVIACYRYVVVVVLIGPWSHFVAEGRARRLKIERAAGDAASPVDTVGDEQILTL